MSRRPRHPKTDTNQAQIIAELGDLDMWVINTSSLGGAVLDLVVCWRGVCLPVEIKMPGCEDDLTDGERTALTELHRRGIPAFVATSTEDVLAQWPPSCNIRVCANGYDIRNESHTSQEPDPPEVSQ